LVIKKKSATTHGNMNVNLKICCNEELFKAREINSMDLAAQAYEKQFTDTSFNITCMVGKYLTKRRHASRDN
jgi:hypothetical protein